MIHVGYNFITIHCFFLNCKKIHIKLFLENMLIWNTEIKERTEMVSIIIMACNLFHFQYNLLKLIPQIILMEIPVLTAGMRIFSLFGRFSFFLPKSNFHKFISWHLDVGKAKNLGSVFGFFWSCILISEFQLQVSWRPVRILVVTRTSLHSTRQTSHHEF